MRLSVRSLCLCLAGSFVVAACGKDSTGTVRPGSLSIVAGDLDSGFAGDQIILQVRVEDADGDALSGVTVTWTVVSGPSGLDLSTSTSDADGLAENTVVLGGQGASSRIRAAVDGADPVTFTVNTVDACIYLAGSLTIGTAFSGTLTTNDCQVSGGFYYDFLGFTLTAAVGGALMTMSSTQLDAFLEVFDATGGGIAANDDIDPGVITNSLVKAILPAGDYVLGASSFNAGETGQYTVQVSATSAELGPCELGWVVRGVATPQQLGSDVCDMVVGNTTSVADQLVLRLLAGQTVTVTMSSGTFAAQIVLFRIDDNGNLTQPTQGSATGPGAAAGVSFTAPGNSTIVLQLGAVGGATSGAYQVSIQ